MSRGSVSITDFCRVYAALSEKHWDEEVRRHLGSGSFWLIGCDIVTVRLQERLLLGGTRLLIIRNIPMFPCSSRKGLRYAIQIPPKSTKDVISGTNLDDPLKNLLLC